MKEYSFIISEKKYTISQEKELVSLLSLFSSNTKVSSIIQWNILMEIDNDLEKIITSYHWLLNCLKYLNEKNSFLLLVKLWDVLAKFINNSKELAEILSRIPEESNKMKLLNILRIKWLTKILFDARDLWNIFEWLYWKSQKDFIDLLWKKFVKNLFLSTNEIIMTLYYLNNENKDYLIDIIWLDWTKNKIKTSWNLLVMFKWLTLKKAKKLLENFNRNEIIDLFKTEDDFYNFLLRLPRDKERLFLNYLKK